MFTGLIRDVGRIDHVQVGESGARLVVRTGLDLDRIALGDSIAVNGACLTVTDLGEGTFAADLSPETLRCTTFDGAAIGDPVNLEPALVVGESLGGHLVQGHVDGVGSLCDRRVVGDGWELSWEIPAALLDTVVVKGSITIDGVSLTVARLDGPVATAAIVPHTAEHTNLVARTVGARVHVETDLVGKYVRRTLERLGPGGLAALGASDGGSEA